MSTEVRKRNGALSSASNATGKGSIENESVDSSSSWLGTFWKFTRPHTIRGTLLACVCGTARALGDHWEHVVAGWDGGQFGPTLARAAAGFAGLLLGNVFIVGINQIYDVAVDRVNKPYLPMAAGLLGERVAWALVLLAAALGLGVVWAAFGGVLFGLYATALAAGAAYSAPPLQLKRHPVAACVIIALARGVLANFGVYYAAIGALGVPFYWSPAVSFLVGFMTLFAAVIALAKDIPDIHGDRQFGIRTFAVRVGVDHVLAVVVAILALDYVAAVALALLAPDGYYRRTNMALLHSALLALLLREFFRVRSRGAGPEAVRDFYANLWNFLTFY
jgi:homogentisate solanesyltransferase